MPVDRDALLNTMHARLATAELPEQVDERVLSQQLGRVVASAVEVLRVDGVGLMLLDDEDVLRLAGASDEPSATLELGQQRLGRGPGVDCVRTGRAVTRTRRHA